MMCTLQVPPNAVAIELAPTGLLQAIMKRTLATTCVNISLMSNKVDDKVENFLIQLAKVYQSGVSVNIHELYPPVPLPVSS